VLVPVVRGTADHAAGLFFHGEATVVGLLELRAGTPGRFLALDPLPPGVASWSAWLEAQPALLVEIRARLDAAA
jgi:hypothetical protein